MDPLLGRLASNITGREQPYKFPSLLEAVVSNSPASRYLTTARQLTDPRKGILAKAANTMTGLRIADVSPAVQDRLLMDMISTEMKGLGARNFTKSFVPDYIQNNLTPEQAERIKKLQEMVKTLESRQRQRKKDKIAELAATATPS
jgi:cell division protein FtsI/penicillin-binding protein 2